jgi:hypothetical protein
MVADVVCTVMFCFLNVATAIAMVLVTVRLTTLVTGYGRG